MKKEIDQTGGTIENEAKVETQPDKGEKTGSSNLAEVSESGPATQTEENGLLVPEKQDSQAMAQEPVITNEIAQVDERNLSTASEVLQSLNDKTSKPESEGENNSMDPAPTESTGGNPAALTGDQDPQNHSEPAVNTSSPPQSDRQADNQEHYRGDYSDSYGYSYFPSYHMQPPGITKFYVGRILTDTTEDQIRQTFTPFGDVFDVRIIKKAYNGQPLRETYYAFVLISLHKTVKEVTSHFEKNPTKKGWNVSLAKESSRNDDYHGYREGSPTRKRRGDFGSPAQTPGNEPSNFMQESPNVPPGQFVGRGGRGMSSADRNLSSGPGPNKFYRDRWNDGRPDHYSRDNWDSNGGKVLSNL